MLATAGKLVFSGSADGAFTAFDASTGAVRWTYQTDSGIIGVPVSYRVDGKQYVAVLAGWGGGVSMFGGPAADATANVPRGGQLYVFALAPATAAAAPAASACGTVASSGGARRRPLAPPRLRAPAAKPATPAFSAAQAAAGAHIYGASCASCHGASSKASTPPPLRADALADATTPTVGELYRVVAKNMPKTNPGSLTPEQSASVMAYFLSANGATPGATALTPAGAAASHQKYVHAPSP